MTSTTTVKDPAEARKRRKEIIQSQRSDGEAGAAIATTAVAASTTNASLNESVPAAPLTEEVLPAVGAGAEKKPPRKRKVESIEEEEARKKTQIRYDPDVPMSKEQLAAWRREARRVRNRESAAASRQRIRNRISELEDEVGEWKNKYAQALQRLEALQGSGVAADGSGNVV
ncbi:unnamed protein product [Cylindrotheca closterium]|uniref:BZIP domain-containing protein n=1 Tax=Cylindrotheca closterium TaxID=2856 RepID=A0AAD2CUZ3_9STRA|nr:unnamed protein product [Cylindrotheca closterium]